jgi:toluene monooxygenase system ferredoxin subunit
VRLGPAAVVLCHLDGQLSAYEDACPHLSNPLSQGVLANGVLICAAHEWEFDARTGHGVNPAGECLRRYLVRLDSDRIYVCVEEDE